MKFKLLSQKIIPVTLVLATGISVAASSIKTTPKDYSSYTAIAVEATSEKGKNDEGKKVEKKAVKKSAIKIGTTQNLPAPTSAAASGQGSPTVTKVNDKQNYKDGTYTGSAQGFRAKITVQVTVKNGKISKIDVLSNGDDPNFFNRAKTLLGKIVKGQTTNVDTVSGATYSSAGLIKAVRNALSKAGGGSSSSKSDDTKKKPTKKPESTTKKKPETKPVDESNAVYKDGSYQGEGEGFGGTTKVQVTISKGKISKVTVIFHEDGDSFMKKAMTLLSQIVKEQTTNLDAVSGATYSSSGIIEATRDALKKAKIKKDSEDDKKKEDSDKKDNSEKTDKIDDNDKGETKDSTENTEESTTGEKGEDTDKITESSNTEKQEDTEPTTVYKDGTYQITVPCDPDEYEDFDSYKLSMSVTIKNDRITEISEVTGIPTDATNKSFINMARKGLVPKIISKGTTEGIDAVSGATCSSKSIIDGCQTAFSQAKK